MLNYLLKYLKTPSSQNIALAASECTLSIDEQLVLGQQGDLLQFVLDSMAEGVIVCDRDLRMVQFNRGASAIFGADSRGDSFSCLAAKYQLLPAQGAPSIPVEERPLARAMKGEATNDVQYILRGVSTACDRWIEICASPIRTADGTILGGMVVLRDISERKAAEEQMKRARDLALEVYGDEALREGNASLAHRARERLHVLDRAAARVGEARVVRGVVGGAHVADDGG